MSLEQVKDSLKVKTYRYNIPAFTKNEFREEMDENKKDFFDHATNLHEDRFIISAARDYGKTWLQAMLALWSTTVLAPYHGEPYKVSILGGSREQSNKAYSIIRDHIEKSDFVKRKVKGDPIKSKTEFQDGSEIKALAASPTSIRGTHPNALCFHSKVPVLTDNGWKRISEIDKGEKVLTHKGKFKKVTKTFKRKTDEEFTKVFINDGHLKCTSNHPLLTKRGWVKAKDLKEDDELTLLATRCSVCEKKIPKKSLSFSQEEYNRDQCLSCGHKDVECKNCGKIFRARKSKDRKFCSRKCSGEYHQGDNNPAKREDVRMKISEYRKENNPMFSDEIKKKVSKINKNRWDKKTRNEHSKIMKDYYRNNPERHSLRTMAKERENGNYPFISEPEEKLYNKIRKDVDSSAVQQYPVESEDRTFYIDIAFSNHKIGIEYDSYFFHDEERDKKRDGKLKEKGWNIMRCKEDDDMNVFVEKVKNLFKNHSDSIEFLNVEIDHLEKYHPKKKLSVYNLEVEEDHSYIIRGGIVAHNCLDESAGLDRELIIAATESGDEYRVDGDICPPRLVMTSTPHVYDSFFVNNLESPEKWGFRTYIWKGQDSYNISEQKIKDAKKRLSKAEFKQEYLGEPASLDSLLIDRKDLQNSIIKAPPELTSDGYITAGVDWGRVHSTAIVIIQNQGGYNYVIDFKMWSQKKFEWVKDQILKLYDKYEVDKILADSSHEPVNERIRDAGAHIRPIPFTKHKQNMISNLMFKFENGRVKMPNDFQDLINQVGKYYENKKEGDDAVDALMLSLYGQKKKPRRISRESSDKPPISLGGKRH